MLLPPLASTLAILQLYGRILDPRYCLLRNASSYKAGLQVLFPLENFSIIATSAVIVVLTIRAYRRNKEVGLSFFAYTLLI